MNFVELAEDCSNTVIACVHFHEEGLVIVRLIQYRAVDYAELQLVESCLVRCLPLPTRLFKQLKERSCDFSVVMDKLPVVARQTQESLQRLVRLSQSP